RDGDPISARIGQGHRAGGRERRALRRRDQLRDRGIRDGARVPQPQSGPRFGSLGNGGSVTRTHFALGLALILGAGCSKADSSLKQPKTMNKLQYPVQVAPLALRKVRYTVMAPGSIEAFQQVQIT